MMEEVVPTNTGKLRLLVSISFCDKYQQIRVRSQKYSQQEDSIRMYEVLSSLEGLYSRAQYLEKKRQTWKMQ